MALSPGSVESGNRRHPGPCGGIGAFGPGGAPAPRPGGASAARPARRAAEQGITIVTVTTDALWDSEVPSTRINRRRLSQSAVMVIMMVTVAGRAGRATDNFQS